MSENTGSRYDRTEGALDEILGVPDPSVAAREEAFGAMLSALAAKRRVPVCNLGCTMHGRTLASSLHGDFRMNGLLLERAIHVSGHLQFLPRYGGRTMLKSLRLASSKSVAHKRKKWQL